MKKYLSYLLRLSVLSTGVGQIFLLAKPDRAKCVAVVLMTIKNTKMSCKNVQIRFPGEKMPMLSVSVFASVSTFVFEAPPLKALGPTRSASYPR